MLPVAERSTRRILVVEDDSEIRDSLCAFLESIGFTTLSAINGSAAFDLLLRTEPPSIILLDLMMPVMNGWRFLDLKRKSASLADVPVVVISALEPQKDLEGARAFLQKPVDLTLLQQLVSEYCRPFAHAVPRV